jgi:hypothetical protein
LIAVVDERYGRLFATGDVVEKFVVDMLRHADLCPNGARRAPQVMECPMAPASISAVIGSALRRLDKS